MISTHRLAFINPTDDPVGLISPPERLVTAERLHRLQDEPKHLQWPTVHALLLRYEDLGDLADLLEARDAINTLSVPTQEHFDFRAAVALSFYHKLVWDSQHLCDSDAARQLKSAIHAQCGDHPESRLLQKLCIGLSTLIWTATADPSEIESAEGMIEGALRPSPARGSTSFALWHVLSEHYMTVDRARRDDIALEKAKDLITNMLQEAGDNDLLQGRALHSLAVWKLRKAFSAEHADAHMLEQAVATCRSALSHPPVRHLLRRECVSDLIRMLVGLFDVVGRLSCLNEAIALAETHSNGVIYYPALAIYSTQAVILRVKAGRMAHSTKRTLLQDAIARMQTVLFNYPRCHEAWRSLILGGLCSAFRLHSQLGFSSSLDECLVLAQASVSIRSRVPHGQLRFFAAYHLARALVDVAASKRDVQALAKAQDLLSNSASFPPTRPQWHSSILALQGRYHMVRFQTFGLEADFTTGWEHFQAAISDIPQFPTRRLGITLRCADLAVEVGRPNFAMCAYRLAIDGLPQMAALGLDMKTRIEAVQLAEGLGCRATAHALTLGDMRSAVEVFEQSRGVVWSQSLQLQIPCASVPTEYQSEFARITNRLRRTPEGIDCADRRTHATALDHIITAIRRTPGYERFLLPRVYSDLSMAARNGYVILLIPSDTFTDVVMMGRPGEDPCHLRILTLKLSRLRDMASAFRSHGHHAAGSYRLKLVRMDPGTPEKCVFILARLWTELVRPIIEALGIKKWAPDTQESTPRLWWCPAGPLAEIPVHAAGIYEGQHQECLTDYVVSSYTPTLSALINAQTTQARASLEPSVLLVSVPSVSRLPPLPNAAVETERVRQTIADLNPTILSDENADVSDVIEQISGATVLHCCCHGHQSQDDALDSGFELHDGRLTLEHLMRLHLPNAQLAYLSACETAGTDRYQPDEAINLASTMLFVGFKSVIATMWSMNDLDGPSIAERVYKSMFREGRLDLSVAPYALSDAVRELRESGAHPSRWATYVHIGA